ncbi:hypothetical protein, partial [Legionella norrlandica]|uniref:hypothetical protein n=1 Tax=Legionella norrlandica TaxID=1498499 RepID=UPI00056B8F79
LESTGKEQVQQIQALNKEKETLAQEIEQLNKLKTSQGQTIDQLKEQVSKQEQRLDALTEENRQHLLSIQELKFLGQAQIQTIEQL